MKTRLLIDVDTERTEPGQVLLSKEEGIEGKTPEQIAETLRMDIGCTCEALVTMIRLADKLGVRSSAESLSLCIEHLTDGLADPDSKSILGISGGKGVQE